MERCYQLVFFINGSIGVFFRPAKDAAVVVDVLDERDTVPCIVVHQHHCVVIEGDPVVVFHHHRPSIRMGAFYGLQRRARHSDIKTSGNLVLQDPVCRVSQGYPDDRRTPSRELARFEIDNRADVFFVRYPFDI